MAGLDETQGGGFFPLRCCLAILVSLICSLTGRVGHLIFLILFAFVHLYQIHLQNAAMNVVKRKWPLEGAERSTCSR